MSTRPDQGAATAAEIIRAIEAAPSFRQQLEALIRTVRELTGCPNVAVRLRDARGGWIPFVAAGGLAGRFLRDEALIHEGDCMCGRVIRGDVDASLAFFTGHGSFYSGDIQRLPVDYTACELGATRGRCLEMAFRTLALVPIRAGGAGVGLLYVSSTEPDGIEPERLRLIESLCDLAGTALASQAVAAEREQQTARILREALAPQPRASIGTLEIGVCEIAADLDGPLGGDFCDAIELSDDRVLVFVGDIAGEGLGVAGLAARCRFVLTGLAHIAEHPGELLAKANEAFVGELPEDRFATVAVAVVDLKAQRLDLALAGHPEPLVIAAEGDFLFAGTAGPPLGVETESYFGTASLDFGRGDTVVLYTDGIPDAPLDGGRFGREGILGLCGNLGHEDPHTVAARICNAAANGARGGHTDDMLALVARLSPRMG